MWIFMTRIKSLKDFSKEESKKKENKSFECLAFYHFSALLFFHTLWESSIVISNRSGHFICHQYRYHWPNMKENRKRLWPCYTFLLFLFMFFWSFIHKNNIRWTVLAFETGIMFFCCFCFFLHKYGNQNWNIWFKCANTKWSINSVSKEAQKINAQLEQSITIYQNIDNADINIVCTSINASMLFKIFEKSANQYITLNRHTVVCTK